MKLKLKECVENHKSVIKLDIIPTMRRVQSKFLTRAQAEKYNMKNFILKYSTI